MKKILLLSIATALLCSQESTVRSMIYGDVNFHYISKFDTGDIVKLPYRMLNTSWAHKHDDYQLVGKIALEYQPNLNNYSFKMDNPQDFLLDLRELYLTWFTQFGEIRIGRQIQSWGFVDENSPLDNACAYDYNFLFELGTDRKIATNALSMDMYYKNLKFGFTTTPFHSINRLPSSFAEFPIKLPVMPNDYQFLEIDKVSEFGAYLQMSTDLADFGVSYFSGYDRIFNLSGINIHETTGGEIYSEPDTVFSYRKTNVLGVGGVTLLGDLTVRADIGYFDTKDNNKSVERTHPNPPAFPFLEDELYITTPILEKAEYYQTTIQLEYALPKDINLLLQFFKHDTLSYSADSPLEEGETIDIPLFQQIDGFNPYTYFYPGMGSPLALMSQNALSVVIEKSLYNDRLSFQIRNLMDLDYGGYFVELNTDYKLSNKIVANFAINYIRGDENHPNSLKNKGEDYDEALDYPLNQMEDFSHYRMQIKYSF